MDKFADHRRAKDCIAQGALTNSKRVECLVKGVYPSHLTRGKGCYLWDTEGKRYIDFITGLGTNILGYANDTVNSAAAGQMAKGATLSLGSVLELETAEMIKSLFPFIDAVKFLKTGSEACSAAIRIARAKTGRDIVLSEGYHGWHDEFISLTPPALGVPAPRGISGCDDIKSIYKLGDGELIKHAAAVIIEPVITDHAPERTIWLQRLRDDCTRHGTMLIFDEIITGFRFPRFSVANFFGITPDIICLGKAIANGFPLSVVGGKYEVMNCGEYFVSSSFAGETISLAAAKSTMEQLQKRYDLKHLWEKGLEFQQKFNALWPGKLTIDGYPTRGVFKGDTLTKALFWQEACKAGILFGPSWFYNFPLIDESFSVLGTCEDIITRIKNGSVTLEGELPASPFAQKVRQG